ncbi:type II toxin-antitoxin system HipA family toxin [Hydrogenophaga sp.]|uniref:type II toxin-antitoxin system HipA family toxin n=1 Tax=Hydrogenophaga sp. TaxID=1904254 RepID=UPI003AF92A39
MAKPTTSRDLLVWMNGERVGVWTSSARGFQTFVYVPEWLHSSYARPLSLSMPLVADGMRYQGEVVEHFFENLLPDNREIRERLRMRFGARSGRAFDLLAEIGRDCIGAIQLTLPDTAAPDVRRIDGRPLDEVGVAALLQRSMSGTRLGRPVEEEDFRISLAGAQEKTALLMHRGQWLQPLHATPTTHILKLPIGEGPRGIDLRLSVENEWLCAQILMAYGVPHAACWIEHFGPWKTLVVERFDRRFMPDGTWVARIPQEDLCQATATHRDQKYQADGGPGIERVMSLLLGAKEPEVDRRDFLKTQLLFWMLAAIDGHAKNFSVFLEAQGRYRLTPRYDVLSAWPVVGGASSQLARQKLKMAMAVRGDHALQYRWELIQARHWRLTARRCGLSGQIDALIEEVLTQTPDVIENVRKVLPPNFPAEVAEPILEGLRNSAHRLMSHSSG